MTLQTDLTRVNREILAKREAISELYSEADKATGPDRAEKARAIKSGLAEINGLIDEHESLKSRLRAERMPVGRQINPADDYGVPASGDVAGIVRGLKSAEGFGQYYGGTTPVTLDQYLRAAFSGKWDDLPDDLYMARGRKDMATDALGTLVLPTPLSNRLIDLTRAASRLVQSGATTVRMTTGTLTFGRLTEAPTADWKTENALIPKSDASLEPVTLTARTVAARVVLSVELSEDSPTVGNAIESAMTAELAAEIDRAGLLGSGTPPEPRGLLNMSGIETIDTSLGLPANYDDFSRAVQAIRERNEEPNAIIFGPDVAGELERLKNSLGDPQTPPDSYRELRKLTTTKLADTAAIGDWSQFVIGLRQDIRVEASREATDEDGKGFASYSVLVRATARVDFAALKPAAFEVLTDINAEAGS